MQRSLSVSFLLCSFLLACNGQPISGSNLNNDDNLSITIQHDEQASDNKSDTLLNYEQMDTNVNDVEASGEQLNDDDSIQTTLVDSQNDTDDSGKNLIFADQENSHQQIDIEAIDPLAEQLTINIPLRFTTDDILNRLNKKVFKSAFNERLYVAMKLTEMSHSLMRSVDNELDEKRKSRL